MQVAHNFGEEEVSSNTNENASFMLTNGNGSYCNLACIPSSRYQGVSFFDKNENRMFKFIENLEVKGNNYINLIRNLFYSVERKKGTLLEKFFMPKEHNSVIYELDAERQVDIIMDCRESYSNKDWGRFYEIFQQDGCAVVKFTKRTDRNEDATDGYEEYTLYMAIKSDNPNCEENCRWVERRYVDDEKRNSNPFRRHVYNALRMEGSKFVFSMARSMKGAIDECNKVFENAEGLKNKEKERFFSLMNSKQISKVIKSKKIPSETKAAYLNCANSLGNLSVDSNVFAGLPWFFQFWTRDSMISLKALSIIDKGAAESTLGAHLSKVMDNGRLPNIIGQNGFGNADAVGWMFLRNDIGNKEKIVSAAEKSLNGLLKYYTKDSFAYNYAKETWMDTDFANDSREGMRIEMQALRLGFYKMMHELTSDAKYKILENLLKAKVKEKFWNGKVLADGLGDFTVRPNSFIAAYAYPELLPKDEWMVCFENSLNSLWLEWGGLSTIDKSHYLFTNSHTGEDRKSYHRGDSWFWINNLAALVLARADKAKFKDKINQIMKASKEEILWKGCIGCHSELSSAKELKSEGCYNQAWSNAMYMEMVDELYG
ncbi:MAG: amylo-alpha-1,6-glucosidase [Nanoarchaeota archaeon]